MPKAIRDIYPSDRESHLLHSIVSISAPLIAPTRSQALRVAASRGRTYGGAAQSRPVVIGDSEVLARDRGVCEAAGRRGEIINYSPKNCDER